jgi:hypothetical protein
LELYPAAMVNRLVNRDWRETVTKIISKEYNYKEIMAWSYL